MRLIGNLPDEPKARAFGDYLLTEGIPNEVESDADASWLVWVLEDDQLADAKARLERFRDDPKAREFRDRSEKAEQLREHQETDQARWRRRMFDRPRVFPGSRSYGAGVFTYVLIAACLWVAFTTNLGEDHEVVNGFLISVPAGGPRVFLPEVRAGEVWRLFTPAILHSGPMHLLGNMMMLFFLGNMIESLQGRTRFLLLAVVSAVISNLVQYHFRGPSFGGMSGVNYALFGYVWLHGKINPASGLYIDKLNMTLLIAWFFLCMTGMLGSVANFAHGAGLVMGVAWGALSGWWANRQR